MKRSFQKKKFKFMGKNGEESVERRIIGKYEMGRVLGEGSFAKVRFARNMETGQSVAIKVLDKDKIVKQHLVDRVCISSLPLSVFCEFNLI